ncbi:MAG: alkaline phosphatase family protein [Myxococcota bacterium]
MFATTFERLVELIIWSTLPRMRSSVLTFLALLAGYAWTARAEAPSRDTGGPLVVIGLDAATYDIIDPLIAAGELPNLKGLIANGARAVLQSESPIRSPALWTTIATGQPRSVHGIYDFVTGSSYWPKGQRHTNGSLVTSDMRRSKALWQYASEAGKRVLVVGWLNSWPAERVNGVMVAPFVALGQHKQTSIKGKIYKDEKRQSYPKEVFGQIRNKVVSPDAISTAMLSEIVDIPPPDSPLFARVPKLRRYLYTVRWSLASALTNFAIIDDRMRAEKPFDLVMTFFDGSDTLAHRFWLFRQPLPDIQRRLRAHGIDPKLAPELKRRFGEAVENYYRFIDRELGRLLERLPRSSTVALVSDHGFGTYPEARAIHSTTPFDGMHTLEGVWVLSGSGARSNARVSERITQYDIVPTLLYRLGLSIPKELPGRVVDSLFSPKFNAGRKTRSTDATTFVRTKKKKDGPTPFENRELERLRSLGYVQ